MTSISLKPLRTHLDHSTPEQRPRNRGHEGGIHVLLADDHRASSYKVWTSLSGQSDVHTVTTCESVEEVLSQAAQCAPELCMVSAAFGTGEGLSLVHRLKHHEQALPVLIYAKAVDARLAGAAMIAGADGVFESETPGDKLAETIGRIVMGERVFPPLLPYPFHELAGLVPEEDRPIVAMLLLRAYPDEIASLVGMSASSFTLRHGAIVECLDTAYARDRNRSLGVPAAGPQPLAHA
jgi:DNA-binding NarL/FixJ family response regulator